jgi:two-component system chemotaxis sensor kinase CheA
VEGLARLAVRADAEDLPGLVAIQEASIALSSTLGTSQAGVLARKISELAETIILRSVPDVNASFAKLLSFVGALQKSPDESSRGTPESESRANGDRELVGAWIASCDAALAELEGSLLRLETSPKDIEAMGAIRRTMHTLKGECGVLSLDVPQRLCHEAETLLEAALASGRSVSIDPFLMLIDWLKGYVAALTVDYRAKPDDGEAVMASLLAAGSKLEAEREAPVAPLREALGDTVPVRCVAQAGTEENLSDFLCESKEHLVLSEEALLGLDADRTNEELINTVFRAFHTIKGVSGFMALIPIVSLAHSAEQLLDGARGGSLVLGRRELDLVLASCDMMSRLLGSMEGKAAPTGGELRALIESLDSVACAKQGGARAGKAEGSAPVGEGSPGWMPVVETKDSARVADPAPVPDTGSRQKRADQTVKVSTTRMDSLVNMVGELVIAQQMVVQEVEALGSSCGARVHRTLGHMSKMIRELQEVSMSLRMVNLRGTFQKMTRLVRDVSQKAGKQIEVVTEGEDVELDRNVVEAMTDPLVHMIRNACDHGIETTEERRASGKPAIGRVALRAYHAGGSIVIEIVDDGRGLRREKLLAKARSKGLLPEGTDEAGMPDSDVFALIFEPGFSTAEAVTDLSGRGVGMDVVKRNIEGLRGKVEIRSTPGTGTTFLLRLPLTMAIIDGMVVRVGEQRYVLPTLSIVQSFRPTDDQIKTVVGTCEMVNVRGTMLPIHRLGRVLDVQGGRERLSEGLLIVLETHNMRICLMVDEILGQHSVVIKALAHTGQPLRGVSGGAILGDGRVALILDVAQLSGLSKEAYGRVGVSQPIEHKAISLAA